MLPSSNERRGWLWDVLASEPVRALGLIAATVAIVWGVQRTEDALPAAPASPTERCPPAPAAPSHDQAAVAPAPPLPLPAVNPAGGSTPACPSLDGEERSLRALGEEIALLRKALAEQLRAPDASEQLRAEVVSLHDETRALRTQLEALGANADGAATRRDDARAARQQAIEALTATEQRLAEGNADGAEGVLTRAASQLDPAAQRELTAATAALHNEDLAGARAHLEKVLLSARDVEGE